jgi:hypothetical protein
MSADGIGLIIGQSATFVTAITAAWNSHKTRKAVVKNGSHSPHTRQGDEQPPT